MAKEECHLVDAFAGEERPTGDGVTKAMHRKRDARRRGNRLAELVALVQYGKGRTPVAVNRFSCASRRARATLRRPSGRRVRVENTKSCGPVNLEAPLLRLRIAANSRGIGTVLHGAVRVGKPDFAVAIELRCELDFSVVLVGDAYLRPFECQQLGDSSSGQRRRREERAVMLAGRGDRLLALGPLEQAALRALAGPRPLGRKQKRDGLVPAQPRRRAAYR